MGASDSDHGALDSALVRSHAHVSTRSASVHTDIESNAANNSWRIT